MKLFGIPIRVDISFFIVVFLLGITRSSQPALLIEWFGVVFVSVLLHEFGHALVGRAFGLRPNIQLYGMGGLTSWEAGRELSPGKHILISLAGPGAGFLFGSLVLVIWMQVPVETESLLVSTVIRDLLWVNFGWGIFNLFPILPLDGGNVMRSLEELIRRKPGGQVSQVVSLLIAAALGLWALSIGWSWVVFLSAWFAIANGSALIKERRLGKDRELAQSLASARKALNDRDAATAVRLASDVAALARSDVLKRDATALLIHGYIETGDGERARSELKRLKSLYGPDPYLEGLVLLETGATGEAVSVLERAFSKQPSEWVAYLLVRGLAREGRYDDAMARSGDPRMASAAPQLYVAIAAEAFTAGAFEVAARAGQAAFERRSDPMVAYNVACSFARAGRIDQAVAWLSRAVEAGFRDHKLLDGDPDIDALRHLPGFQDLRRRVCATA
jgi:Zn-dependent protease